MSNVLTFPGPASPPAPPKVIELELRPVADRPGTFDAVDAAGRVVVRSRQPSYAASRALLAEGIASGTILQMRHENSPHIAMSGRLAELAKWTIHESDKGGLQRKLWQPFQGIGADSPAAASQEPASSQQAIGDLSVARAARRAPGAHRSAVARPSRRLAA